MRHVVIVGGGAALAQPLIDHFLTQRDCAVTAVCRTASPDQPEAIIAGVKVPFKVVHGLHEDIQPADVLVTLTGRTADVKIGDMTSEKWDDVMDATLRAPAFALNCLLPEMPDGGNVVVVGSVVGSTGGFGCANYAAAKAGLVGLVRAAANEFPQLYINLLELGFIDAGMGARIPLKVKQRVLDTIPLKRFGTEDDFVHAVEFLSTTKYMTGGVLTLAGGLR